MIHYAEIIFLAMFNYFFTKMLGKYFFFFFVEVKLTELSKITM